jgi:disulfide bond formation protein DsbB
MYPLVAILAIGLWSRARRVTRWIALPVATIGAGVAVYHWLVERVPALAETSACSLTKSSLSAQAAIVRLIPSASVLRTLTQLDNGAPKTTTSAQA